MMRRRGGIGSAFASVAITSAAAAVLAVGCTTHAELRAAKAAPLPVLRRDDSRWLERTSFG